MSSVLTNLASGIPGEIAHYRASQDAEDVQRDAGTGKRDAEEHVEQEEQRHQCCDTQNAPA